MKKAFDFLRVHNEGVLATVSEGKPCLRAFQIMKQEEGTLYFATAPQKEVYRQMQGNPNIEFMVLQGKVSVRCSGTVLFDVDDETCRWIYDNNPVLPRLYTSYDKLVYFRLPVERLEYFDLRPTPPVVLHYDINADIVEGGFAGERFGIYKV
ncbi:MAG: pyridoxamine 5'-phosphate oxidase family protein [Bacteroidales bacterium]|nr:pyridoxamine 5'-phosphate oxidase family protein [Bacteroidales bacterium]